MEWIKTTDRLPESDEHEEGNTYYFIYGKYGVMKAMFIDNEWWNNYSSKIVCEITHWIKIEKPKT